MKDKFNKYCSEVMGYNRKDEYETYDASGKEVIYYNPYDDLNQMTEVVEMLVSKNQSYNGFCTYREMFTIGIKQAFRDFIISTMGDSE